MASSRERDCVSVLGVATLLVFGLVTVPEHVFLYHKY